MYEINSNIEGQTIIHIEEIALPFEKIVVKCVIEEKTKLPLINEFILKAIKIGTNRANEISKILGLREEVINEYLAQMITERCLTVSTLDESYTITNSGLALMDEFRQIKRSEKLVTVLRSSLTGNLFHRKALQIKDKPKDRRAIKAPSNMGNQYEIDTLLLQNTFPRDSGERVLKASTIVDTTYTFALAKLVIFEDRQSGRLIFEIGFETSDNIHNQNRDKECELIVKKLEEVGDFEIYIQEIKRIQSEKLVDDFEYSEISDLAKKHKPQVIELTEKIQKNENAQEEIRSITRSKQLESEDSKVFEQEQEYRELKIKTLIEENNNLKNQLNNYLKSITTYEHPGYFEKALLQTSKHLLLVSPWITQGGLSSSRVQKLENLLKNKVQVYIGYGIIEDDGKNDQKIINTLTEYQKKYKSYFHFRHLGKIHSKILASDDKFHIVGSFNWMSYPGRKERDGRFRMETSIVISSPELVNKYTTDFIAKYFK